MTKKLTLREIIDALQHLGTGATLVPGTTATVEMAAGPLSFDDIQGLLRDTISAGAAEYRYWVRDVFPDTVVYEDTQSGKLFRDSYSIDPATRTCTLTDTVEVIKASAYEPVAQGAAFAWDDVAGFSADAETGQITRSGKIFELGDYPDKDFSLSEAEADAAIAGFTPVPLELEHVRSIFDGHLGSLTRVWRDGTAIHGTVQLPAWADGPWAEQGRKISAAWDRGTKAIRRAGLVLNPRVADAALMAAFAGARVSAADRADMQQIHDISTHQGATCAAPASMAAPTPEENHPMTLSEKLAAWLKSKPAEFTRAEIIAALDDATVSFAADDPRIAAMRAELDQVKGGARVQAAQAECSSLLHEGFLVPAQVADFTAALSAEAGLATFTATDGASSTLHDRILAGVRKGVKNRLTEQQIPGAILFADPAGEAGAEDPLLKETRELTAAYLANTPQRNRPLNGNGASH